MGKGQRGVTGWGRAAWSDRVGKGQCGVQPTLNEANKMSQKEQWRDQVEQKVE